jgi:ribonuclease HI
LEELMGQARYWARESLQACCTVKEATQTCPAPKWRKPREEVIKINFDGAFHATEGTGGWGFIARDSDGAARLAGAGKIRYAASALQAEALACGEAVQAATDCSMGRIVLESDSKNLVAGLNGSDFDLSPEGVLFKDLRLFILLNFISVEVVFAHRGCNKAAHELAALGAAQEENRVVWWDSVPESVRCLVASESAAPS